MIRMSTCAAVAAFFLFGTDEVRAQLGTASFPGLNYYGVATSAATVPPIGGVRIE